MLKLASWNVNGLRAVNRKGAFVPFLNKYKPDVLCLQEIKIDATARKEFSAQGGPASGWDFPNYTEYYYHAEKKGYSGTATFVKESLGASGAKLGARITNGLGALGAKLYDEEGRVQTLEFPKFYLVNAYFPNTRHDLSRLDFKGDFNNKILAYVKKLDKEKPVILTGDYNVAHKDIDLARPKDNVGNPGFHPDECAWMTKFLESGFVDTFRHLHPTKVQYSWWSQRFGARARNVGWRIDYFCLSKCLTPKIKKAEILDQVMGSDHCPVTLEVEIGVE